MKSVVKLLGEGMVSKLIIDLSATSESTNDVRLLIQIFYIAEHALSLRSFSLTCKPVKTSLFPPSVLASLKAHL
jgi:hypothetical protein